MCHSFKCQTLPNMVICCITNLQQINSFRDSMKFSDFLKNQKKTKLHCIFWRLHNSNKILWLLVVTIWIHSDKYGTCMWKIILHSVYSMQLLDIHFFDSFFVIVSFDRSMWFQWSFNVSICLGKYMMALTKNLNWEVA